MKLKIVFAIIEQGHFRRGLVYKVNRMWTPAVTAIMAEMQRLKGHTVRIFDANACGWDNRCLSEIIIAENPGVLVLMSQPVDRWQNPYPCIERQKDFVATVRKTGYEGLLLAVGPHPTLLPEHFLKEIPEVDYIIRGEPEPGVDAFIDRVVQQRPFEDVPGISARILDDVVHFADERHVSDLNSLPQPAYDLLPMHRYQHHFYSRINDPGHRFAFIETTRGCPFACSFCNLSMYGRKVRHFSVSRILAEIDLLVSKYKINYLFFGDLSFGIKRRATEGLLLGLITRKYDLRWSCQTRIDLLDERLIDLMSRAGCHRVEAGIETAHAGLMDSVKNIKLQQVRQQVELLKNAGIKLESGHLAGLPGQTAAQIWQSAKMLKKIGIRFKITSVTVPYPRTVDYERGVAEKKITVASWDNIVAAAGKCGNNLSDRKIEVAILMVQCLYYWHIFASGSKAVVFSLAHFQAVLRGISRLALCPRNAAGAIKRIFEDAVYGAE